MLNQFHYGVCYYPEHWHPRRHASDIDRIADAGFDFVRMGEGAWNYWEPREGEFQFELFDHVIDLCRKREIKVVMGTPTYAAPAWVVTTYPEVLRWNFERIPMAHGSRRNLNYTSPKYLDLSDKLCTALAEHYQSEKQIIAWQLDNEFNCHMDVSYAPSDTVAWREWLKEKYRTPDALNAAWGTAFWAQTYDAWEQIDLPHPTATYLNPSVLLDETRFISDCVVRFAARQAAILRRHQKQWKITHNALFANIDGPKLVKELDFFSHDQYPLFYEPANWPGYAWNVAQARGLSFPYAIMEQQSGPGGQMTYLQRTPNPGEMRLWAWQSVAHGANALAYFRWRTCPCGSEQHWHGLLDADDRDTRRLAEAKQTGDEFRKLPPAFLSAAPEKVVALLRDFDSETNDRRINTYTKPGQWETGRWSATLLRRHVPVDQVWSNVKLADLQPYKLVVAPHLTIVTKSLVDVLNAYVRAGGTLVLGAQSGQFDQNCHVVEQPMPGLLRALAGVDVQDWTVVPEKQTPPTCQLNGKTIALDTYVERLQITGENVRTLAAWTEGHPLLGPTPAVTQHPVDQGSVVYVAGFLPQPSVHALAAFLLRQLGIQPVAETSDGVEIIARSAGERRFICLMNHSDTEQSVRNLPAGTDVITSAKTGPDVFLPPYGVAVIEALAVRLS